MNRKQKIAVLLTILIVLTGIAAVLLAEFKTQNFPYQRPGRANPADLELYYYARTILSTVNVVLTVILIANFVSIYLKTKSQFSVGLALFASFFLIKDIAWSPFVIWFAGFNLFGLGPFAFIPDLFEMAALLVLFYLSVKY